MNESKLIQTIVKARDAHRLGMVLACDTYLRHALSISNAMKRRDATARIMTCRNHLRPAVLARRAIAEGRA